MTLDAAVNLLTPTTRILVFTGAGVSTESGIPDFRGPNGVWRKVDPDEFTFDRYISRSETRMRSWARWSDSPLRNAEPNAAHLAVVTLADRGRLEGCVTQNIDGLHQAAGLAEELTVEVHGNVREVRCLECDAGWATDVVYERIAGGEEDPHLSLIHI